MKPTTETLCVTCRHACTGACSWSESLTPVDGWDAEPTPHGYLVLKCHQYRCDLFDDRMRRHLDPDGVTRLMEAVARVMRDDYINGTGPYSQRDNRRPMMSYGEVRNANRKLIEHWLCKGPGRVLMQLSNPEEVIGVLRKMARMHDIALERLMRP